jgi:uncharacterized protein YjiS (DUF1127 family)
MSTTVIGIAGRPRASMGGTSWIRSSRSPGLARSVFRPVVARYWRQRTMRELSRLEDARLQDIGVERADIPAIATDLAQAEASAWARRAAGANGFGG